ncbi:hypothetical protein N7X57_05535 [Lactiplantibacillus paraplantarum]|uniref:hypothetical protein n=1 Tax=Lactiplantibacillus paraplantarum TaxID=60520 RepID=UPI002222A927|nr:hypothetical protein [Lactiplantibacillus paraplantarum]MCW1909906.1 hypothetical protein [Lactiplantibacillus paraplantarum]
MSPVIKDYQRVACDYDKALREFDRRVNKPMKRMAKYQHDIQRKNDKFARKIEARLNRIGVM